MLCSSHVSYFSYNITLPVFFSTECSLDTHFHMKSILYCGIDPSDKRYHQLFF